jgi:hypothetical protein
MLKGSMLKEMIDVCSDMEVKGILRGYAASLEAQGFAEGDLSIGVYLLDTTDCSDSVGVLWGFSPLVNRWSGAHFKTPGFHPYWEHLIEHHNWFEMLCLEGDGGSGSITFIPKDTADEELLQMCRLFSQRS